MDAQIPIECIVSLALLIYVWFFGFSRLRRDNFRTDIRRIRDNLFDFMWRNDYDMGTPTYREVRQTLNGMLRFSNTLSLMRFLALVCIYSRDKDSCDRLDSMLRQMNDQKLKKKLESVLQEAVKRLLVFLFLEGTRGFLICCFSKVALTKNWAWRKGWELLSRAYEIGGQSISDDTRGLLVAEQRAEQRALSHC